MAKNAASMVQRAFDVKLSDAAMMALEEAGQAPEVTIDRWCWNCEHKGKIILKIAPQGDRKVEMIVEATCSHLADEIPSEESEGDRTVYLVWSRIGEEEGSESWALLTPYAAWLAGFRFMQDEAAHIEPLLVVEQYSGAFVAVGVVVTDLGKLTEDVDKLRDAVRVAKIIETETKPALWRKPSEEEMELLSWVRGNPLPMSLRLRKGPRVGLRWDS